MEKNELIKKQDLLEPTESRSVFAELGLSMLKAGAIDPVRGVAQITDQATGKRFALEEGVKSIANRVAEPIKPAEFSTAAWYAQQLGSAVGMMAPFFLLRSGVTSVANKAYGDGFLLALHKSAAMPGQTAKLALAEAAISGTSGVAYGTLFVPSERTDSFASFAKERVHHALYDGLAFGAIGGLGPYVGKAMGKLASTVENGSIGKYGNYKLKAYESAPRLSESFDVAQAATASALRSPLVNGAISGIPIGLINAEVGALKSGNWLPDQKDVKENVVAMMFVGGALATANHLARPKEQAKEYINLEYRNEDGSYQYMKRPAELLESPGPQKTWIPSSSYLRSPLHQNGTVFDLAKALDRFTEAAELSKTAIAVNSPEWQAVAGRFRELSEGDQFAVRAAWDKLSEQQKTFPASEILALAQQINALKLNPEQATLFVANPEYLLWHADRQRDMSKVADPSLVFETWLKHPEWRERSPREMETFAKLTEKQKAEPFASALRYVKISIELELKPLDMAKLKDPSSGFIRWFDENKPTLARTFLAQDFKQHLAETLNNWGEIGSLANQLPPTVLATYGSMWKHLTPEQRVQSSYLAEKMASIYSNLKLESAEVAKITPSFIEWYQAQKLTDTGAIASGRDILKSWDSLSAEHRQLNFDDLQVIAMFNKELRQLDGATLSEFVEVARKLKLQSESAAGLNAEFLPWFKQYENEFEALMKASASPPQNIARVWSQLPAHLRAKGPTELNWIARAWDSLSEAQRQMPVADLVVLSRMSSEFSLSKENLDRLAGSPDFTDKFTRLESRWSKAALWRLDIKALSEVWPDLPAKLKQMADRDLLLAAGAWPKLTPEQRQLPPKEIAALSHVIREMHLSEADTARIQNAPGFLDWFSKRERDSEGFEYSTEGTVKKVLGLWDVLTPEMRKLPAKDIKPIVEAWEKLSDQQKQLPARQLADVAFAITKLELTEKQLTQLAGSSDFATWFRKNHKEFISKLSYNPEEARLQKEHLIEAWSRLSSDRMQIKPAQLATISTVWERLSEAQRKLPISELTQQSQIVSTLKLEASESRILGEHPEFVAFFNENYNAHKSWSLDNSYLFGQLKQILSVWPELTTEIRALGRSSLYAVANSWKEFSEVQKQIPAEQLSKVATVLKNLRVEKELIGPLGDISAFANWYHTRAFKDESASFRASLNSVLKTWSKLDPADSKNFESWLERNFHQWKGEGALTTRQLAYMDRIIENWQYFSKAEREQAPALLIDKATTLGDLTIDPNGIHVLGGRIPERYVDTITSMKAWQQIAALKAWREVISERFRNGTTALAPKAEWNSFVESAEFSTKFEKRLKEEQAKGRSAILAESKDLPRLIKSYHPTLEPLFVEFVVAGLRETKNPEKYIQRLNPKEYKDALDRLLESKRVTVEQFSKMDLLEAADNPVAIAIKENRIWENDAAIKLITTFGSQWRTVGGKPGWLDLQQTLGRNGHDATSWLTLPPRELAESLGTFLLRFYDRDPGEIGIIAKRWESLSPEQRSGSYKDILAAAVALKYDNVKSTGLAIEAARWGIDQQEFQAVQTKFLKSLDTPSPFPLNQTWINDGLTGRFLARSDARGLFLGRHTDCCQHATHSIGRSSAWMGQENPNAGFFVVENKKKDVVAQSLVWESDNGGLMFDSIEGKKIADRAVKVAELYEKVAGDLMTKYHTIAIGNGSAAGSAITSLGRWPVVAEAQKMKMPFDYGGYSDAKSDQVLLAQNSKVTVRQEPVKQVWVRGAVNEDRPAAQSIMEQVYPAGWRFMPTGDWHRVMEARGKGLIGGYILDVQNRAVNDAFVHPDFRSSSRILLFDMLKKIRAEGGEWSASMRESTSYQLLKKAVAARWLTITDEVKRPGKMQGEDMFDIKFTVNTALPAAAR